MASSATTEDRTRPPAGAVSAHIAWAAALALAWGVDALWSRALAPQTLVVALIGLAPAALVMLAGARLRAPPVRAAVILCWAVLALAAFVAGGEAGAGFAALFVAPAAAAAALGPRRLVFEAAGLGALALMTGLALRSSGIAPAAGAGVALGLMPVLSAAAVGVFAAAGASAAAGREARRAAAEAHRRAQAEGLLALLPDVALRLGPDGAVSAAAGAVGALLGARAETLLGAPFESVFDKEERPRLVEALAKARRWGEPETLAARAGGERLALEIVPQGDATALAVIRARPPETEKLRGLEADLAESRAAYAAKSLFFAGLAHELRTPLNAVLGFSDAMRASLFGPLSARYAEYVDLIHQSAAHLLDLVNAILDLSKIEAGRYEIARERLDLNAVAEGSARLVSGLAEAKGVRLRCELGQSPLEANADPRALKQVLLNLLSNAIKFTPKGGTVTLRVRPLGERLALEVADTGEGMTAVELARIARPYVQTASGKASAEAGTGLGLAVVKALVALHGGKLEAESVKGEGATFRVLLPAPSEDGQGKLARFDARARLDAVQKVDWAAPRAGGER